MCFALQLRTSPSWWPTKRPSALAPSLRACVRARAGRMEALSSPPSRVEAMNELARQPTAMVVLASEQLWPNLHGLVHWHGGLRHLCIYHTDDRTRSVEPARRLEGLCARLYPGIRTHRLAAPGGNGSAISWRSNSTSSAVIRPDRRPNASRKGYGPYSIRSAKSGRCIGPALKRPSPLSSHSVTATAPDSSAFLRDV